MVSRSRVRVSRLRGVVLHPKVGWFLRRSERPPFRRRPRRDATDYRMPRAEQRAIRERYGLRGRQLRRVLAAAAAQPGDPGTNLVELLEQRLDVLLWRAGFAPSVRRARRMIRHRDIVVDGQTITRPSYRLTPGQTIEIRAARLTKSCLVVDVGHRIARVSPPAYLDLRPDQLRAVLTDTPRRPDAPDAAAEPVSVEVVTG